MRMIIDRIKCSTAGMCVKICPEVFRFQERSKKTTALFDNIPASLEKKCLEAVDLCPNKAIFIIMK
jgi:ferredoxin